VQVVQYEANTCKQYRGGKEKALDKEPQETPPQWQKNDLVSGVTAAQPSWELA